MLRPPLQPRRFARAAHASPLQLSPHLDRAARPAPANLPAQPTRPDTSLPQDAITNTSFPVAEREHVLLLVQPSTDLGPRSDVKWPPPGGVPVPLRAAIAGVSQAASRADLGSAGAGGAGPLLRLPPGAAPGHLTVRMLTLTGLGYGPPSAAAAPAADGDGAGVASSGPGGDGSAPAGAGGGGPGGGGGGSDAGAAAGAGAAGTTGAARRRFARRALQTDAVSAMRAANGEADDGGGGTPGTGDGSAGGGGGQAAAALPSRAQRLAAGQGVPLLGPTPPETCWAMLLWAIGRNSSRWGPARSGLRGGVISLAERVPACTRLLERTCIAAHPVHPHTPISSSPPYHAHRTHAAIPLPPLTPAAPPRAHPPSAPRRLPPPLHAAPPTTPSWWTPPPCSCRRTSLPPSRRAPGRRRPSPCSREARAAPLPLHWPLAPRLGLASPALSRRRACRARAGPACCGIPAGRTHGQREKRGSGADGSSAPRLSPSLCFPAQGRLAPSPLPT
jgi:hypothetical protein